MYISPMAQHPTILPLPQIKQPKHKLLTAGMKGAHCHRGCMPGDVCACTCSSNRRWGSPDQPQARAPSQQECLGVRWSKPSHGDAHRKGTRESIYRKRKAIGKERRRDGTSDNPVTFISFS